MGESQNLKIWSDEGTGDSMVWGKEPWPRSHEIWFLNPSLPVTQLYNLGKAVSFFLTPASFSLK